MTLWLKNRQKVESKNLGTKMTIDKKGYTYYAFISYNSRDIDWGKRLQRKLEHYRMPAALCSQRGWKRRPMIPVFFAPTDIQPGGLSDEIKKRLRAAKNLIVICSPNSAQSEWVGKEIEYFHELGRDRNIHFFIIDGIPNSGDTATECFNPVVKKLGIPEILGANIHEKIYRWSWLNRERAYVQLISKLLGVEFDSIWQRHRRLLVRRIILWTIGIVAVIAALLAVRARNLPVDIALSLNETSVHNENLPPLSDAVVTIAIDKETKTDTVESVEKDAIFANIPHSAIGKDARITVTCPGWYPVDTVVTLSKNLTVNMNRDPHVYGDVTFRLWSVASENGVAGVPVTIAGERAISGSDGRISLFIPLPRQNARYRVECDRKLETDTLTMPTNESTAMVIL